MDMNSLIRPPQDVSFLDRGKDFLPSDDRPDYLSRVWFALKRFRLVALAILVLGILLTMVGLAVVRPSFSATATIMLDGSRAQVGSVGGSVVPGLPMDLDTVTNEVQVITSRTLISDLVHRLRLDQDPDYDPNRIGPLRSAARSGLIIAEPWLPRSVADEIRLLIEKPTLQGNDLTDAVIDEVTSSLSVGAVGRSRAISITFRSPRPVIAETVANTLAQLYLANQKDMKQQAAASAYAQISGRLVELQTAAAEAAQRAEQFRAKSGLIDGRDTTLVRQQISELSTQLGQAELDRLSTASRLREAERAATGAGSDSSAEVLRSPLIQQLRLQQAQVARDAASATTLYGERYSRAEVASAQQTAIQRAIGQEIQKILSALRGEHQAAVERESGLQARMGALKTEMARVRASEVSYDQLAQNAGAAREIYEAFLRRAKETSVGSLIQSPDAYIISQATVPITPVFPNRKLGIAVGAALSVALAFVAVLSLEARDGGFLSQTHIARVLGLATIGVIPRLRRGERIPAPLSVIGTAITDLYLRIVRTPENRCVLMTSAFPREGKTSVSLTLARIAAHNGRKTLFINADLRRPRRPSTASRSMQPGLSELLAGTALLEEVVRLDEVVRGVSVLEAGASVDNPAALICSTHMRDLLSRARRSYDLIIIDSPPVLVGPEAWALALLADTTLLFVRWAHTPCKAVLMAYRTLSEAGASVSGVVLTMVDVKRLARYGNAGDAIQYAKAMSGYYASDAA